MTYRDFFGVFVDVSSGPRDPITCKMMIGVHTHLLRKVFRLHYHSQKVIGSLGWVDHMNHSKIFNDPDFLLQKHEKHQKKKRHVM